VRQKFEEGKGRTRSLACFAGKLLLFAVPIRLNKLTSNVRRRSEPQMQRQKASKR
jgi:hypothetical protein